MSGFVCRYCGLPGAPAFRDAHACVDCWEEWENRISLAGSFVRACGSVACASGGFQPTGKTRDRGLPVNSLAESRGSQTYGAMYEAVGEHDRPAAFSGVALRPRGAGPVIHQPPPGGAAPVGFSVAEQGKARFASPGTTALAGSQAAADSISPLPQAGPACAFAAGTKLNAGSDPRLGVSTVVGLAGVGGQDVSLTGAVPELPLGAPVPATPSAVCIPPAAFLSRGAR